MTSRPSTFSLRITALHTLGKLKGVRWRPITHRGGDGDSCLEPLLFGLVQNKRMKALAPLWA